MAVDMPSFRPSPLNSCFEGPPWPPPPSSVNHRGILRHTLSGTQNDPRFDLKWPCFGGKKSQNREQTGSFISCLQFTPFDQHRHGTRSIADKPVVTGRKGVKLCGWPGVLASSPCMRSRPRGPHTSHLVTSKLIQSMINKQIWGFVPSWPTWWLWLQQYPK